MNRTKVIKLMSVCIATIVVFIGFPLALAQSQSGHENHSQMNTNMMQMGQSGSEQTKTEVISLEKVHSEQIPVALQHIETAINAIETGRNNDALAELRNVKFMIAAIDNAVSQHITPKFINNKCPIMGSAINPANVTEDLIREYKGQKVAFCCKMCPAEWNKLSDTEKEAKLAKVRIDSPAQGENKI
ncbi:MAG: hypothetical protein P8016_02940 [Sedimentisphaerales bacterium]